MKRAAVSLVLAMLLAGCPEKNKNAQDPKVVAIVNGEIVSTADFTDEVSRELGESEGDVPATPEQVEPFKKAELQTVIERTLLLQAARKEGIQASPEEVDREVMKLSSDYPTEGFDEALAQGRTSVAQLKQRTAELLTIEKLFQGNVYPRVGVTEEEIRQYFEEHATEFQEPEKVHAAQIVVKGRDEAERLLAQLRAGKKFADLARKYSLSADAKVGGDLGFFERGVMPPEFDEVAFKLGIGQVSDVVSSPYGFHLIKVLERRAPGRKELVQVRAEVEKKLLQQKRAQAERDYIQSLRDKAEIKVNELTLQAVTPKPIQKPATQ